MPELDFVEPRDHEWLHNDGNPLTIPHQGGLDVAPGNTMAAIMDAWDQGYDTIETDGRWSEVAQVLVASHDDTIDGRLVERLSVADLAAMQRDGYPIALIRDIYDGFPGRVSLDIKPPERVIRGGDTTYNDPGVDEAIRIVKDHRADLRTCVASFYTRSLLRLRAALPDAASTMSFEDMAEVAALIEDPTYVPRQKIGGDIASVEEVNPYFGRVVSPESIAMLRKLRKAVLVWTLNEPEDMTRLLDMHDPEIEVPPSVMEVPNPGIDGFYTDAIRRAKRVMQARDQWRERTT